MRILGIDSSTPQCSVALLKNQSVSTQILTDPKPSYSNHLLALVDRVLSETGESLSTIDGFALTIGPGSFTGLRVGLSLVKGFVLALEKPFVGVGTLEALAATLDAPEIPVCAVLDARKQEVYAGMFEWNNGSWNRTLKDDVLSPDDLAERIQRPTCFVGSGIEPYGALWRERLGDRFVDGTVLQKESMAASAARLAATRFEREKSFDLNTLTIEYLRKSEAEIKYNS